MGNWGSFMPITGIITLLITGRGPPGDPFILSLELIREKWDLFFLGAFP